MTELAGNMPKAMYQIPTNTPEVAGQTIVYCTQRQYCLAGGYTSCRWWDMPKLVT
ncbi:hypothetical protein N7G274_009550 [Stereocaulon virgatum]|uniref:Uncharacterized protein n=1 Tax=Stereocaulon virgatum TaxID=373712 RepID=A0ABR3ZXC9_9LECA